MCVCVYIYVCRSAAFVEHVIVTYTREESNTKTLVVHVAQRTSIALCKRNVPVRQNHENFHTKSLNFHIKTWTFKFRKMNKWRHPVSGSRTLPTNLDYSVLIAFEPWPWPWPWLWLWPWPLSVTELLSQTDHSTASVSESAQPPFRFRIRCQNTVCSLFKRGDSYLKNRLYLSLTFRGIGGRGNLSTIGLVIAKRTPLASSPRLLTLLFGPSRNSSH